MEFRISNSLIGDQHPIFIVAELSANHLNDFELAVNTIKAMKEAGADAVKLQTYTPDTITIDCANEYFQIQHGTIWDGTTLYQLYKEAYMPWEWQHKLKEVAEDLGLILFSTPFDRSAVDFLEEMGVPAYKVASPEITDIPLIEYIASKNKPIFISTGLATSADIKEAIEACNNVGNYQIALLKCTTAYPAPFEEINLRSIPMMAATFSLIVGLSDHTLGISVPIAAAAIGARIIEKHFILDRNLGGPDSVFSLEPKEFRAMVGAVRQVEMAMGQATLEPSKGTEKNREFLRSLFVVKDIARGETLTEDNIRSIRPGYGLAPKTLSMVLGRKAKKYIKKGTPLTMDLFG